MKIDFQRNALSNMELEVCLQKAFQIADRAVDEGATPGGVLAVGNQSQVIYHGYGVTTPLEGGAPVDRETLYDLASLTKLFTTFMALHLLEKGEYRLDDPVSRFLPAYQLEDKAAITMRQLMTHTSGLKPHDEFFRICHNPREMLEAIVGSPMQSLPGEKVAYSCLGYISLAQALEKIAGQSLPDYLRTNLFEPLEMQDSGFTPPFERKRIAPTEQSDWDNQLCWGVVHDENARCQGGISGNAGMFSNAKDLTRFAQMWLGQGDYKSTHLLSPATVQLSIQNYTKSFSAEYRGLGWLLKAPLLSFMGDLTAETSFGHTGFTGTSLVINPELGIFVIWLTNRVHPTRKEERLLRYRALVHNAVFAALT